MTVRTPDSGLELLEQRYERLAHVIVYVLLAVPLIPYVLSQKPSADRSASRPGSPRRPRPGSPGWTSSTRRGWSGAGW